MFFLDSMYLAGYGQCFWPFRIRIVFLLPKVWQTWELEEDDSEESFANMEWEP